MRSEPPLRADARRNHDAVLGAAIRVLTERPDASMREIADASGLTRTTVYRHFPSRDDLLRALLDQIERESAEAARAAIADDPPLAEAMAAFAHVAISFGQRYRFLAGHGALAEEVRAQADRAADDPVLQYLALAQRRGDARTDLPPSWQLRIVRGIVIAAVEEVLAGSVPPEQGERLLARTLVGAFAAERPDG